MYALLLSLLLDLAVAQWGAPPSPSLPQAASSQQIGLSAATSQQTGLSAATAGQGCTTVDPGAILLNQEIDLFANLFPSPTSYLTVHDRLCGNSKTLLVSAFTKMAEQFCFPSAPGMDWLNAFMREVRQSDVERMADCFCTATKDIDTSNAALNEISVTIAAAVSSNPPNIASLMSSSFLDLVKTNLLTLGGDVCNGDCRETWARMIIIFKGPSILNVGDDVLTDAEAYDPWDCMCSMEVGYLFDHVAAVVADLRPLVIGMVGYRRNLQNLHTGSAPPPPPVVALSGSAAETVATTSAGQVAAATSDEGSSGALLAVLVAKAGLVFTHFLLRPGGMCPKPVTGWILSVALLLTTTLIATGIAICCMRKANGPRAPKKMLEFTGTDLPMSAVPGQVAGRSAVA